MVAGKVVGLGFEIISKFDSYFLMTVTSNPILVGKELKFLTYNENCKLDIKLKPFLC